MDFDLSEDQRALQEAAARLLEDMSSTLRARQVAPGRRVDERLWSAMAEQGWLGVEGPEDAGGLGAGMVEVSVLSEQLGRHVAAVPFLGTVLAAGALRRAIDEGTLGDEQLGEREVRTWARRLAGGEAIGAVAWSRRADAVRWAPRRTGDPPRLSGRGDPVVYGPAADIVVVCASDDDGPALFAVEQSSDAVDSAEPAMDITRSVGWFDAVDRPAVRLGGPDAVSTLFDRAVTGLSAEMLGSAARVLEMTVQYAKDRVQFGRPIGSFQAVKHRCADMLVDVEGMRSTAFYAAWAVGAGDPDASIAASAAKIWCSDAARRVMSSGLQVHGGIGFTWEHDMHLFLKRSQLDQTSFGDATFHRERLAALLRPRVEAGRPVL